MVQWLVSKLLDWHFPLRWKLDVDEGVANSGDHSFQNNIACEDHKEDLSQVVWRGSVKVRLLLTCADLVSFWHLPWGPETALGGGGLQQPCTHLVRHFSSVILIFKEGFNVMFILYYCSWHPLLSLVSYIFLQNGLLSLHRVILLCTAWNPVLKSEERQLYMSDTEVSLSAFPSCG